MALGLCPCRTGRSRLSPAGLWQNQISPEMELESHVPPASHLLLSRTRSSTQEVAYVAPEGDSLLPRVDNPTGDRVHSERLPRRCPLPAAPKNRAFPDTRRLPHSRTDSSGLSLWLAISPGCPPTRSLANQIPQWPWCRVGTKHDPSITIANQANQALAP